MPPTLPAIDTPGIADLQKALRSVDPAWTKELRQVGRSAVEDLIADTRDEWRRQGGSLAHTADVARALAVKAEQRRAGVKDNPKQAPTVKGAEYGAKRWPQFPPFEQPVWRDGAPVRGGYGIHEALRQHSPD